MSANYIHIFNINVRNQGVIPPHTIKHHSIKEYGWVEVQFHSFLSLALNGGEWSISCPCHCICRERTFGNALNRWVDVLQSKSGCSWEEKSLVRAMHWTQKKFFKWIKRCWDLSLNNTIIYGPTSFSYVFSIVNAKPVFM